VQSKISLLASVTRQSPITATEYGTLQDAYDHFNRALFDGALPQVLITLQRSRRSLGYFSPERFQCRGEKRQRVHEVALNPNGFTGSDDVKILSTLVHEMTHVWQQEYGRPGRGPYHNREFARKMHSVGLMASSTGRPGGAETGDSVSHYILEDGKFIAACHEFMKAYRLVWEPATEGLQSPIAGDGATERTKVQTRTKFTCPNCGLNVWAKPGALIDCHRCTAETRETIVMLDLSQAAPPGRNGATVIRALSRMMIERTGA
jgi:hypothetical protein